MWEMKKVSLVKIWQTKKIFKQFSFILVIDPKITNTDRGSYTISFPPPWQQVVMRIPAGLAASCSAFHRSPVSSIKALN